MPITYRIDPHARLVRTTVTGVVTDADLIAHKDRLNSDPAFGPGMSELSDVTNVHRLDVTSQGVRTLVWHDDRHSRRFAGHKLAIVANEDVVYGMARMYQTQSSADVGVFRSLQEALSFLGKPDLPS